jgi:hypothetical protein
MAHNVVYIIKVYNIPTCIIVNTFQIWIYLTPRRGDQTWETQGFNHIHVLWIEYKKKITSIVPFSTNGSMIHLQIVPRNKLFIHVHESRKKNMVLQLVSILLIILIIALIWKPLKHFIITKCGCNLVVLVH